MVKTPLARLQRVDLRECWQDEARDFTPWLAQQENITLLGEALGMELEVQSTEQNVGPFSADILCKELDTGHTVLVENQLEKTDHNHFGQILTYAAGLEAAAIIWIARNFTDEHRAALDWLNRVTNESVDFFGLEVELWRIGDSALAPKFNIVCQPNDWRRRVAPPPDLTELQRLRLEYWAAYGEFLRSKGYPKIPKPYQQSWVTHSLGKSGFYLASAVSTYSIEKKRNVPEVRMDFVIDHQLGSSFYYPRLEEQREAIEAEVGEHLLWHNPANTRLCRIYASKPADFRDRDDWQQQFEWMHGHLLKFQDVFGPRVRALTAETPPKEGEQ